jgi:outer membrane protein TolC
MPTRYCLATLLLWLALGCASPVSLSDEDIPVPWDEDTAPLRTTRVDPSRVPAVLTLEVARRLAIEQNPETGMAAARVEAARARVARAASAYLPQIDLKTGYTHTYDFSMPQLGDAYRAFIPTNFEVYDTSLQGTWLLFDGFVREFNVKAAALAREESKASYKDIERLLVRAVEQTYYEGQQAKEAMRIAEADAAFNRQMLDATEQMRVRGKSTRPDVNNFEIRLKTAESNALAARRALAVNYMVLEELLGLTEGTLGGHAELEALGEETGELLARPDEAAWLAAAENGRPDVAASLFARKRGEAEVGAARSAWLPSLVLNGSYGWQKLGDMRYSSDEVNSSLLLGLGWNLFNGGATLASVREAKARADEASYQIEKRTRAAVSEVRQGVTGVTYAQERLVIDARSAALAAETRDDVRKGYEAEKMTLTRLNEAQRDAVMADARHAQARILLRQAWSTLKSAAGGKGPAGTP